MKKIILLLLGLVILAGCQATETIVKDTNDAFKGNADAPVTIIEYSDYECPYCAKFALQTLPSINEQYIQTGKVKMIFKDFPLAFHKKAQKASEAAQCAGEQGNYYGMHDLLFSKGVAGVAAYKEYAKELELDSNQFNKCLDSGKMEAKVKANMKEGQALGVKGTPAFFINGRQVTGAQPFSVFKEVIEEELNK